MVARLICIIEIQSVVVVVVVESFTRAWFISDLKVHIFFQKLVLLHRIWIWQCH